MAKEHFESWNVGDREISNMLKGLRAFFNWQKNYLTIRSALFGRNGADRTERLNFPGEICLDEMQKTIFI